MAEKSDVLEKMAKLKKMREDIEARRLKYQAEFQEVKKYAEDFIPKLKGDLEAVDAKIAELQKERSGILEQLKEFGEKVGGKGLGKAREGGKRSQFKDMLRAVGVGAVITNDDIEETLGSASGFVGMIVSENIKEGLIQRVEAGKYKVVALP